MSTKVAKPAGLTLPVQAAESPLCTLRAEIAELRMRMRAAQAQSESSDMYGYRQTASVRIFDPNVRLGKNLSADRDVSRRQDEILKLLRERGPLRFIGAAASEALATRIATLYESHANFAPATDYLLQEEILARHQGKGLTGIRLLLYGSAGLGKTDYALRFAELVGLPTQVIGFSSAQSSAGLGGSEVYWGNTEPGLIWKQLIHGDYANWVCVMDEIDKADKHAGDPLGALFQLLEARSAKIFTDKSVPWLEIDASHINFIATANDIRSIHPAIISRFTIVEAAAMSSSQRTTMAQKLYACLLQEHGLQGTLDDTLHEEVLERLVRGSVRDLKRVLRQSVAIALQRGASRICIAEAAGEQAPTRIGFIRNRGER